MTKFVLYRYSTSNHNSGYITEGYGTVVLYRYSTSNHNVACYTDVEGVVVLYRYSTSNHNNNPIPFRIYQLSYIVILHQTTTVAGATVTWLTLSYIVILHQTTTMGKSLHVYLSCLISLFYIKPQHRGNHK